VHLRTAILLVLGASLALTACKKEAPPPPPPPPPVVVEPPKPPAFKVAGMELGNRIGPDKKVVSPTTSFPKTESTIYLSVATDGVAPSVALKARWTYGAKDQLVNETAKSIVSNGPAQTEFEITKKGPWPAGKYKVVLTADGVVAGTKEFEVK